MIVADVILCVVSVGSESAKRYEAVLPLTPRLLGVLTPCTKARAARNYILEAKALEEAGHIDSAVTLYMKAERMIPKNEKLKQKIHSLLHPSPSSSSSSSSSPSSSSSQSRSSERPRRVNRPLT